MPCESCDFSFLVLSFELLYCIVCFLILNRYETSRFEPLNPAKHPIHVALPAQTNLVLNQQVITCEGNAGFYEVGLMTTPLKGGTGVQ